MHLQFKSEEVPHTPQAAGLYALQVYSHVGYIEAHIEMAKV